MYFEQVVLSQGGTVAQPIRIMADEVEKDRVVLMGEVPNTVSEAPGGFWAANNTIINASGRAFTLLN